MLWNGRYQGTCQGHYLRFHSSSRSMSRPRYHAVCIYGMHTCLAEYLLFFMMHSIRIQRTYTTHQAVWCFYWGLGDFQVLIETFLWQGLLPSCKWLCAGSQWFGDTITCGVLVRTFRGWLGRLGLDYTFTWDHLSGRLKLIILIASTLCVASWRNWTAEEILSFLWEWLQVEADSF